MSDDSPLVFKVGGSLFTLTDLAERLDLVLSHHVSARLLIVVGGGAAADWVREWSEIHALSAESAHWLALRAMSLNERLLQDLIPRSVLVTDRTQMVAAWNAHHVPILATELFLLSEERCSCVPLPHDWSTTSDSIAAWVAHHLGSRRLTLLKSVAAPLGVSLREAADAGLVDNHFSQIAQSLDVSWVNVRSDEPRSDLWTRANRACDRWPHEVGKHAPH